VNPQNSSKLDLEPLYTCIKKHIQMGATNTTIQKNVSYMYGDYISTDSIRRFRIRHGLQVPGTEKASTQIKGDEAEAVTAPREKSGKILDDPDTMLKDRGLNPNDWYIDAITVNEWDGPKSGGNVVTYYQAKFTAKRKRPEVQLMAARSDGWKPDRRRVSSSTQASVKSKLIVVVGDQQAPFHDKDLDRLFRQWLREHRPDEGVLLGDTVDFPDISRHQLDPENTAVVNECIQSGYDLLRGYVDASANTSWKMLHGNHCDRIRNLLLDQPKMNHLYGIKRADTSSQEGEDVLGLMNLLRLDELGIEYVSPHGKYDLGQIKLSDRLAVRHGWLARKGSGSSALGTLEHLGFSIICGHTHRQAQVFQSKAEIDGRLRVLTGVEAGCMCRVEQSIGEDGRVWPSYAVSPDWQQGFCTVRTHPDGTFKIDLATYVNGTLLYRDRQYKVEN
jgi:hypothetical protein